MGTTISSTQQGVTMNARINPFHDLYLSEGIAPGRFVELFSPHFVEHALPLYMRGNVILKGLQGGGKTMLLNLLKPEVRLAFRKANQEFPVPKKHNQFISAGINLRTSGVIDFGALIHKEREPGFDHRLALLFGDFVNYWIADDLLQTIQTLCEANDSEILKACGVIDSGPAMDEFAKKLASDQCWFGYLDGVDSLTDLKNRFHERIFNFKKYINLNIDELPEEITNSKTVINEPLSKMVALLREANILTKETQVYIRIDQYEQLTTLNFSNQKFGRKCENLIHKALAARDSNVFYRIGVRHYAWSDNRLIFGTTDTLENKRDFSIVNIDEVLRRKEDPSSWFFPQFAEDIFRRRLKLTTFDSNELNDNLLLKVFGKGLSPDEKVAKYVSKLSSRETIARFKQKWPEDWPVDWIDFLKDLGKQDPLSAILAGAWVRQKDQKKRQLLQDIPTNTPYPWEEKKYWRKERIEQALLQAASRNRQQLIWSGKKDILALSGGNILIFLFICQQIWDAWLRDSRDEESLNKFTLPQISTNVQSIGILNASEEWVKKTMEGEQAFSRKRFIEFLGKHFYKLLTDDVSMSYPGRNGLSLELDDLANTPDVEKFLKFAVDRGDLHDLPHTSKTKSQKRCKYYLSPIYSPVFKIPYQHTKEPEYLHTGKLTEWMEKQWAPSLSGKSKLAAPNDPKQRMLF